MILERTYIQNPVALTAGTFAAATDFREFMRSYQGHEFYVISAVDYAVACTVELKTNILHIRATMRGKNLKTFDKKITTRKCAHLPLGCVFHFNYNGSVVGVTKDGNIPFPLQETTTAIFSARLTSVPKTHHKTAEDFVAELISQIQHTSAPPWQDIQRVGFYIGDLKLKHTNSMALAGIVVSVLPKVSRIRIKGIQAHAPEYAETVFWLELKQKANKVHTELSEGEYELSVEFMRKLAILCL